MQYWQNGLSVRWPVEEEKIPAPMICPTAMAKKSFFPRTRSRSLVLVNVFDSLIMTLLCIVVMTVKLLPTIHCFSTHAGGGGQVQPDETISAGPEPLAIIHCQACFSWTKSFIPRSSAFPRYPLKSSHAR